MTLDDLKIRPLRKGEWLYWKPSVSDDGTGKVADVDEQHQVIFKRKLRGRPQEVVVGVLSGPTVSVEDTIKNDEHSKKMERIAYIADLSRTGNKAAKKQPTLMILCRCEHCGLKVRVSRKWIDTGAPRCWNHECEGALYIGADGKKVMKPELAKHYIGAQLTVELGKLEEGNPAVLGVDAETLGRMLAEHNGLNPNWEKMAERDDEESASDV